MEGGFNIVCGEEVKGVLKNGTNGINGENGTSCDAVAVEGGFNIVCGDEVKGFLRNGTNGTNGTSCDVVAVEASEDAPNGGFNIVCDNEVKGFLRNGIDGVNGTSCDAVAVDGGFNIVCGGEVKGFIKSETESAESSSSEISSLESSSSESSSSSVTAIQTGDNTTGSIFYPDDKKLKDLRDGRIYKTTSIGNQIWMAENMFYQNATSWTFTEATRSSPYNICPNGWKVPSKSDYETLISAVGGSSVAAAKLKDTKGWDNNGNGTNESGFSATPYGSGTSVSYWTSTEGSGCSGAWVFSLRSSGTLTSSIACANQTYSYPLRCLKK